MKKISVLVSLFLIILLAGCATYYQKSEKFQGYFQNGQIENALDYLEKNTKFGKGKAKLLYFLDKGVVANLLGKYELSNEYFITADRIIEDYQRNIGLTALTFLSNPTIEPYHHEDFESVLIHYFTTLNFIKTGNYESALVEVRRMNIKLLYINDNRKEKITYKRDAFAHNLMGMIYEADYDKNNAFIAFRNAFEAYDEDYTPNYNVQAPEQLKRDVLRLAYENKFFDELDFYERKFKTQYNPIQHVDHGELIFFWQNGLGPVKVETVISFTVIPGAGGAFAFRNDELGLVFPFPAGNIGKEDQQKLVNTRIVRVAFPKFVERRPVYNTASLAIDGQKYPLELAEDINAIAFQNMKDRMVRELGIALLRVALKQAASEVARKESESLGLALDILGAITEKADTRNWQTLPHSIYYTRISLPAGAHTLQLNSYGKDNVSATREIKVEIKKGEKTFKTFQTLASHNPTRQAAF